VDAHVPLVFVTGDARDPRLRGFERAATLVKPATPDRLLQVLAALIAG